MTSICELDHSGSLAATHQRLCNEKARLAAATTTNERQFRERQIVIAQKELDFLYEFLGMNQPLPDMSEDDLLAALAA